MSAEENTLLFYLLTLIYPWIHLGSISEFKDIFSRVSPTCTQVFHSFCFGETYHKIRSRIWSLIQNVQIRFNISLISCSLLKPPMHCLYRQYTSNADLSTLKLVLPVANKVSLVPIYGTKMSITKFISFTFYQTIANP